MTSDVCGPAEAVMIDAVVLFHDVPHRTGWFWRLLKPGFGHVQTWILSGDRWVQIDGCLEALFIHARDKAPWELVKPEYNPTYVAVRYPLNTGRWREPFHFGPVTCVELTKAVLGIRAFTVRTPYQLYKYLQKKN